MRLQLGDQGIVIDDGGCGFGPARPAAVLVTDGVERSWKPQRFEVDGESLRATGGPGGACIELRASTVGDDQIELAVRLSNRGTAPLAIAQLTVFTTNWMRLGADPRRWRIYRNGYQSWSGTYTLGVGDRDRDLPFGVLRAGITDRRHRAAAGRGRVRSDLLTAIAEPKSGDAVAIGFLNPAKAFGFTEVEAPGGYLNRLCAWADLDGSVLAPNQASAEVVVRVRFDHGRDAGWRALRAMATSIGTAMQARRTTTHHPGGWCSWYYYFNRICERDVLDNLQVLAADGRNGPEFGCEYVMIDDGHQSAIGDWLRTSPEKFPNGMAALARNIHAAGFDAGIWWAPFLVAPDSEIAQQHPEWLVKTQRGRPIVGCSLNPWWGVTKRMAVLDTTRPDVLAHLEHVARTIREWGYAIQKLDFLYAAALPGTRLNPDRTRAESLRAGLEAIRRGAGDDAFLLGCGAPMGPGIGIFDAMRIGADVTPYWSNWLSRTVLRNVHGLATRHALMNTLTRAALDGVWWLNDPDCLMVRDSETELNEEEVRSLATIFGLTNGMVVLSDRLDRLPPERRALVARARELAGGEVEIADLFERQLPELIVSRRAGRTDVAVVNFSDQTKRRRIALPELGIRCGESLVREYWTDAAIRIEGGIADFGDLPAHATRVASFR